MGFKKTLLTFLIAICCNGLLEAQVIYVSPNGNDKASGTRTNPIATFAAAQERVRISKEKNANIIFLAGRFYLPETVRFTSKDSKASVVYMAEKEGTVVISGGKKLKLEWKRTGKDLYTAKVPTGSEIDQLYTEPRILIFLNPAILLGLILDR